MQALKHFKDNYCISRKIIIEVQKAMKKRFIGYLIVIGILVTGLLSLNQYKPAKSLLPHLPAPIARTKVLVTPAGQGPEALVVAELCDILNLTNHFMYWAEPNDLEGFSSLLVVLGFSKQGLFSMHKNAEEEIERVRALVSEANKRDIPVVLIHLGGSDRRSSKNDKLASAIAPGLDYIIVTEEGEEDRFFSDLAGENNIPITIVPNVTAVKVPLNSVYR